MEQEDQDKVLNTRWNKKGTKYNGTRRSRYSTKYTMEQEDKVRWERDQE